MREIISCFVYKYNTIKYNIIVYTSSSYFLSQYNIRVIIILLLSLFTIIITVVLFLLSGVLTSFKHANLHKHITTVCYTLAIHGIDGRLFSYDRFQPLLVLHRRKGVQNITRLLPTCFIESWRLNFVDGTWAHYHRDL